MKLSGKVAIVTAAAGAGVGQATVRALAKEGADVVVSDAHAQRPFTVAEDIASKLGVKALGIQCDVSNVTQVENMVKKTLDEFGRIDILVNDAGVNNARPLLETTDENWDWIINVNLKGAFYCARAVAPAMIKQKWGRIINFSSIVALNGNPDDGPAYVAAKAGILGLTKELANELAPHSITVNVIAPGFIWNPFLERTAGYSPEVFAELEKKIPVGRRGYPDDIANTIAFLVSDEASYITGQTFCVNGGWYMH